MNSPHPHVIRIDPNKHLAELRPKLEEIIRRYDLDQALGAQEAGQPYDWQSRWPTLIELEQLATTVQPDVTLLISELELAWALLHELASRPPPPAPEPLIIIPGGRRA